MSGYKIDWSALLETADDIITKCEEFYGRDEPMTGIEELRGVEHAYYESLAEDTDKILRECEEECFPINTKVTPTKPIELGQKQEEELCHCDRYREPHDPRSSPNCEKFSKSEEAKTTGKSPVQGATQAPPDYPYEKMTPRAQDLYNKFKDAPKEEEAPIDAASVKEALQQAITDATSLLQGLEEFVGKIESLDLKDIDNALDEAETVMTMIRYAKDGFGVDPETDQPYSPEESMGVDPDPDAIKSGGDQ
jgi:hypothetical protein